MKIEVTKGVITHESADYGIGKTLDIDDKKAERLIALGFAKKAGSATPAPAAETKPPATEPKARGGK